MALINQPIGIFDSGVGGLGVFRSIVQLLPYENIVYVADNNHMPFGKKTAQEVQKIAETIVRFLIEKHNVKLIVIACNTATVASIDYLRTIFSIPFVGVVPVVKPACEQTKTGCVAIMATPLTAKSLYIKDLILKFSQGTHVLRIGCPGLADLIEEGKIDGQEVDTLLRSLIAPALKNNADIIGLCSTHYPFICQQLQKIVGPGVTIIDSNAAIACQVKRVLQGLYNNIDTSITPRYVVYATKNASVFKKNAQQLVGDNLVPDVQFISL
jgi:glutamate racemase